jgi:hypothetical protein
MMVPVFFAYVLNDAQELAEGGVHLPSSSQQVCLMTADVEHIHIVGVAALDNRQYLLSALHPEDVNLEWYGTQSYYPTSDKSPVVLHILIPRASSATTQGASPFGQYQLADIEETHDTATE